jgi:hypothetical protein
VVISRGPGEGESQDAQAHEAVKPAGSYTVPGDPALDLALRIDDAVKRVRMDGGVCRHASK